MNWFSQTLRKARMPHRQRGAAVVEFALILPILLVLLVGTIDVSLALYDKAVITNASREGARAGIVARSPALTEDEIKVVVEDVVKHYLEGALVSLGSPSAASTKACEQPTVKVNKGLWKEDEILTVTVCYIFQGVGLGSLSASLGKPWLLQSSTVMVYE
jgi:Flp pilus assembly protein TadG